MEALATASPLSVKYLNSWDRKCDQTSKRLSRLIAQEVVMQLQHLKTDLKCVSSLLVDVGLKRVGFGLHCSDSLQDFLLSEKTS